MYVVKAILRSAFGLDVVLANGRSRCLKVEIGPTELSRSTPPTRNIMDTAGVIKRALESRRFRFVWPLCSDRDPALISGMQGEVKSVRNVLIVSGCMPIIVAYHENGVLRKDGINHR